MVFRFEGLVIPRKEARELIRINGVIKEHFKLVFSITPLDRVILDREELVASYVLGLG